MCPESAPPTVTSATAATSYRIESDLLGPAEIPVDAYWGVHTARAVTNFPISGTLIGHNRELVRALAVVKRAAALANRDLGLLEPPIAEAIVAACDDVEDGRLDEEFLVDVIQGGAGTSTNMNANEVIANRALELMGRPRADYATIHPNEHVNLGQSTNDVYPTAVKLATYWMLIDLQRNMRRLQASLAGRGEAFRNVQKIGRTQLQDAVPMTLGHEFSSFARTVGKDVRHVGATASHLLEINLGGTAIGTGVNTHPEFSARAREHLVRATSLPVTTADDLIEATQDCGAFVLVSSALKHCAVKISKMCNDLRLLSSGPRGGLKEIRLPARQAGSSIMPGKVNPVIPEAVNQIAFQVVGNDVTVSLAAEGGQLQLNAFEPIIAHSIFASIKHLAAGFHILADLCVEGITADEAAANRHLEESLAHATTLSPRLGYAMASRVAREALSSDRTIREVILAWGLMSDSELDSVLDATVQV